MANDKREALKKRYAEKSRKVNPAGATALLMNVKYSLNEIIKKPLKDTNLAKDMRKWITTVEQNGFNSNRKMLLIQIVNRMQKEGLDEKKIKQALTKIK